MAAGVDDSDYGIDFYVVVIKVYLGVLFGYNLVWNVMLCVIKVN